MDIETSLVVLREAVKSPVLSMVIVEALEAVIEFTAEQLQTEMLKDVKESVSDDSINKFDAILPLGVGKPSDVSNTVLYLLSGYSSWVTGENIKLGLL